MTWIKFLLWLSGIYSLYYAGMLAFDGLLAGRIAVEDPAPVLTFTEEHQVKRPEPGLTQQAPVSSLFSSGGLSLKQLFNLAREEAIEYTRPVSF